MPSCLQHGCSAEASLGSNYCDVHRPRTGGDVLRYTPDPEDPATGGGSDPKSPLDKPGDDQVLDVEPETDGSQ